MRISARAEYACLAAVALAQLGSDQNPVRVRDIAEAFSIPERFLLQILLQLKGSGLVYSARGASGGYRLARPADKISLGEILYAIDGQAEPPREPKEPALRMLASIFDEVRDSERAILHRTSIAELAAGAPPRDWVI